MTQMELDLESEEGADMFNVRGSFLVESIMGNST